MPKSNIVFRAALEDDESDDEIVVIPYTKPPPVVIDLLESESENNGSDQGAVGKRSSKKKSKRKRNRREKERSQGQGGFTDVVSLADETLDSSMSSLNVSACVPDNGIECDSGIISGQVVEPATSTGVSGGSENVAAVSIISATGFSSDTQLPSNPLQVEVMNEERSGSGSHFEKCLDAQSSLNMEVNGGKGTETDILMDGTSLAQNSDKTKKVKSKEKKSKGEGKSRTRTSSTSATQRTNEEIVNFLTTLGIPMEPNAFETPVTRKKQSRKRPSQVLNAVESEGNSLDSSATNSNDGQNFPVPIKNTTTPAGAAFVSVTQDTSGSSKRDHLTPKGRRQRQAISGDLSDYTVSFTSKDLNAINTSFQSNIIMAETENTRDGFIGVSSLEKNKEKSSSPLSKSKPNYYSEIIDAVARGLEPPILDSSNSGSRNLSETDHNQQSNDQQIVINEINAEEKIESINNKKESCNDNLNNGNSYNEETSAKTHDSVHNHIEETQTSETTIVSINSDPANGMSENQMSPSCQKSDALVVPKELASGGVGNPSLNLDLEKETSGVSVDKIPCSGTEKPVQSPGVRNTNEGNKDLDIIRDVECGLKFSDNQPSVVLSANKNSGEARVKTKGNKENSDFSRRSPERKRRRVGSDIIPGSSKTVGRELERTPGNEERLVEKNSSGSGSVLTPAHQITANNNERILQESYYPSTWSEHMRDFYGSISNENFEMDEIWPSLSDSVHLWRAHKDMMPPPRDKRRHVRCDRCKQFGHLIKECKEKWKKPTCHYCGEVGHTSDNHSRHSRTCPSALCLNCGRRSSRYAQKCHRCLLQNRPHRCEICNVSGHDMSICPDNWRRYHSVTSSDEYEKIKKIVTPNWSDENHRKDLLKNPKLYKRPSTMYCANCGRRGHCYYDCNGSKFNPYPRHKPFVICETQTNEIESIDVQRPQYSGSSAASTPIPISYDSRTGRTVVMNSETMDQPELEVEIIQVKITNELAFQTDESKASNVQPLKKVTTHAKTSVTDSGKRSAEAESTSTGRGIKTISDKALRKYTCKNKKCTNKLWLNEKCYQTFLERQAHLKLYEAEQKGLLKELEEKNQVQICVINDGCKIHTAGLNVLETDKDLHDLLWKRKQNKMPRSCDEPVINFKEITNNKINNDNRNNRNSSAVVNIPQTATVYEEDECVIMETTNLDLGRAKLPEKERTWDNSQSNEKSSQNFFYMDQSASVHAEEIGIDKESSESESSTNIKNGTAEQQTISSSMKWSEYVSPLVGLSLNSEPTLSANNAEENKYTSTHVLSSSKSQKVMEGKPNTDEDMDVTVDDSPSSPDMFDDVEEMDYSTMEIPDTRDEQLSKITTEDEQSSDSDLIVLDPPPKDDLNVEIITLDDEDEPTTEPPKQTTGRKEESVTLLQSEWELTIAELTKKDNIINQISQEFNVDVLVSKEISSVLVRNGTDQARKLAKDEIVFWLESKCLNTDYHLIRRKVDINKQTNSSTKRKYKPKPKQKVQRNNLPDQQKSNKKSKKKSKWKLFNNSNSSGSGSSSGSPNQTTSPINNQSNRRNFKKSSPSSPFNSKGMVHSPTPKKMQQLNCSNHNNNNVVFPIARNSVSNRRKMRYFENYNN